jgi:hypothetical protein
VGARSEYSGLTTITNGPLAPFSGNVTGSGATYIYRRSSTGWAQEAYIKATNALYYEFFGGSVSLSGDTLAVGAEGEKSSQQTITNGPTISATKGQYGSGAVYVYRRSNESWGQEAFIKAANAEVGDGFGVAVSLSGDTLAVGSHSEASSSEFIINGTGVATDNSFTGAGAVYVFRRTGVEWQPEAYIKAANAGASDRFGNSVSVSGDTIAVAAWKEDSSRNTILTGFGGGADNLVADSGAVYVYRNRGRMFEPHVQVSKVANDAVILNWHSNLGSTKRVKIAPASAGNEFPASCTDAAAVTLAEGVVSYTYSGLQPNSKYGFRICAFDSTTLNVSAGRLIWANTAP